MKKLFVILTVLTFFAACAQSSKQVADLSFEGAVKGKNWKLVQTLIGGKDTGFNRDKLAAEGFDGFFVMNFNDRLTGTAAPNLFNAPYKVDGKKLDLGLMVSTKMALLNEPKTLRENDFFRLIEKTYEWELKEGALRLFSKDERGAIVLIFAEG